jgi:hypothetical protein
VLVRSADAFLEAIDEYEFRAFPLDADVVAVARQSIAEAGLLVVGEPHGVAETPALLYRLAVELETRVLALEWSHDELGGLPERLDLDGLWSLPTSSEFFAGDGRYTAGHFALIRRLRAEARLEQLILFDRLDPVPHPGDWRIRDRDMAERFLAEWHGSPALVVAGGFHASDEPGTMAELLRRERPGLRSAMLEYAHLPPPPPGATTLRLPRGTSAALPQSGMGVKT